MERRREIQQAVAGDVEPALEPRALRRKGRFHAGIAPSVHVRVPGCFDNLSRISFFERDGCPPPRGGFPLVVDQRTSDVEQPVSLVEHYGFNFGDFRVGGVEFEPGADHVCVTRGCYHFAVRSAEGRVVDAEVEVDFDGSGEDAFGNVQFDVVFLVVNLGCGGEGREACCSGCQGAEVFGRGFFEACSGAGCCCLGAGEACYEASKEEGGEHGDGISRARFCLNLKTPEAYDETKTLLLMFPPFCIVFFPKEGSNSMSSAEPRSF